MQTTPRGADHARAPRPEKPWIPQELLQSKQTMLDFRFLTYIYIYIYMSFIYLYVYAVLCFLLLLGIRRVLIVTLLCLHIICIL